MKADYYRNGTDFAKRKSFPELSKVGVLAGANPASQHTTCTYEAAVNVFTDSEIKGYPSFEDAIQGMKDGHTSGTLVPAGYPNVYHFIQDTTLYVLDAFTRPIPPLVYAGRSIGEIVAPTTIYLHPSPERLAEGLNYGAKVFEKSNERVCQALLDDPDPMAACITNALAADFFGLITYRVLGRPNMPWILFINAVS